MNFIKDKAKVMANLKEMPDASVVTIKGCKIHFPERFVDRNLAYMGQTVYCLGYFNIIVDDKYSSVFTVNATPELTPTKIEKINVGGVPYYELIFNPGSTVIKSLDVVKIDTTVYDIYDEFLANGHLPYYTNYDDLAGIYDTAKKHAGANMGDQAEVTELIVSVMARWPNDREKYYRQGVSSHKGAPPAPVYIPIESVESATNTTSRLAGAYFETGLKLAIATPAVRNERIEDILRR